MGEDIDKINFYNQNVLTLCTDKVVLEIGPGSEMVLTMEIIKVAKHTNLIESNPTAILKIKQYILDNNLQHKVTLYEGLSFDIQLLQLPDTKVDIIVHEIFGSTVSCEGIIQTWNDSLRFLSMDVEKEINICSIPQNAITWFTLIEYPSLE